MERLNSSYSPESIDHRSYMRPVDGEIDDDIVVKSPTRTQDRVQMNSYPCHDGGRAVPWWVFFLVFPPPL